MCYFSDFIYFVRKNYLKYGCTIILLSIIFTAFCFWYWSAGSRSTTGSVNGYFTQKDEYPASTTINYYCDLTVTNATPKIDDNGNVVSHDVYNNLTGSFVYLQNFVKSASIMLQGSIEGWENLSMEEQLHWVAKRFSTTLGYTDTIYTMRMALSPSDNIDDASAYMLLSLYSDYVQETFCQVKKGLQFKNSDILKFSDTIDAVAGNPSSPFILFFILAWMLGFLLASAILVLSFVFNKKMVSLSLLTSSHLISDARILHRDQISEHIFLKICQSAKASPNCVVTFFSSLGCAQMINEVAGLCEKYHVKMVFINFPELRDIEQSSYVITNLNSEKSLSLLAFEDHCVQATMSGDCVLVKIDVDSPVQLFCSQNFTKHIIFERYYASVRRQVEKIIMTISQRENKEISLFVEK